MAGARRAYVTIKGHPGIQATVLSLCTLLVRSLALKYCVVSGGFLGDRR